MLSSVISFFGSQSSSRGSFNRSSLSNGIIEVQVGRSVDARTVPIPQSVLKSCTVLRNSLTQGCRIVNADPVVFATIIEYLESCNYLGISRLKAPGHLQELTSDGDALFNFAKAWHLGDMLDMPTLQNKLVEVFRLFYIQCLTDNVRVPMNPKSFTYLRDHIGYHTKAERFIVDFHAGLMQKDPRFVREDIESLPSDVAINIIDRWHELSGQIRRDSLGAGLGDDRIAAGIFSYRVEKTDTIIRSCLQIQSSCARPGPTVATSSPVHCVRSEAAESPRSVLQREENRSTASASSRRPSRFGHSGVTADLGMELKSLSKPTLSNPFIGPPSLQIRRSSSISPKRTLAGQHKTTHNHRLSTATIRGLQPPQPQPPRRSRTASMAESSTQASLGPNRPTAGPWSHDAPDFKTTDEESTSDLLATNQRWDNGGTEQSGSSVSGQRDSILGFLGFAAS